MRPILLNDQEIAEFHSLVLQGKKEDCWEWLGEQRQDGYPRYKRLYLAHRIAYSLEHGVENLDGLVLHSCENGRCCNPAHLVFINDSLRNAVNFKRNLGLSAEEIADSLKLPLRVIVKVPRK